MTGAVLALVLAAARLPVGDVRFRAELAGQHVGVAELSVACRTSSCDVRYRARLRLPAESGGVVSDTQVELEVDRFGRYQGGRLWVKQAGAARAGQGPLRAVPATLGELVLAAEAPADGSSACVPFFDEERPELRRACARREGGKVLADLGGSTVAITPGPGGFPAELLVAGRFRYVRDDHAEVPRDAPRLAGSRVPGPADPRHARSFCDQPVDPAPVGVGDGDARELPPLEARGDSCREKTAAWLAAARRRDFRGRTAVGVAWDGKAFVWHAWPEVQLGGVWVPVDPSLGQLPATGPRFTIGRYEDADAAARDAAGARILRCWGVGGVE